MQLGRSKGFPSQAGRLYESEGEQTWNDLVITRIIPRLWIRGHRYVLTLSLSYDPVSISPAPISFQMLSMLIVNPSPFKNLVV